MLRATITAEEQQNKRTDGNHERHWGRMRMVKKRSGRWRSQTNKPAVIAKKIRAIIGASPRQERVIGYQAQRKTRGGQQKSARGD